MAGQQRSGSAIPHAPQRPQPQHRLGEATHRPSNFYFEPGSMNVMNMNVHMYPGSQVYFNGTPHQSAPAQGGQSSASSASSHSRNAFDMDYGFIGEPSPSRNGNTPVNEVLSPAVLASTSATCVQATSATSPCSSPSGDVSVRASGYTTKSLFVSSSPSILVCTPPPPALSTRSRRSRKGTSYHGLLEGPICAFLIFFM